ADGLWFQGLGLLLPENQGCLPRKAAMNLFLALTHYFKGIKSSHLPAPPLPAKYRHAQSWILTKCG
ncbi:hypothetical protein ACW5XI_18410, partial [Aeromonas australiensis]